MTTGAVISLITDRTFDLSHNFRNKPLSNLISSRSSIITVRPHVVCLTTPPILRKSPVLAAVSTWKNTSQLKDWTIFLLKQIVPLLKRRNSRFFLQLVEWLWRSCSVLFTWFSENAVSNYLNSRFYSIHPWFIFLKLYKFGAWGDRCLYGLKSLGYLE